MSLTLHHSPLSRIISPIIHRSLRHIRAPRALIPALNALTVAEEFSCYRVFTISSVLSRISLIQNQPHFNFASMRTSRAHLAYTYTPSSFMIVLDFAFFTLIRIFCDSTYHVDIILVHPNKGFPFMSSRNIALDLQLIRCSRIISTPNFTYHLSPVHILTIYPPILAYSEDIAINAPKRDYACSSRAHYRPVEHPNAPYVTPLGHAFNLYCKVQEFIPPVTSKEVEEFDDEDQNALTFQPTHSIMRRLLIQVYPREPHTLLITLRLARFPLIATIPHQ
ncbi:hypothetical protein BD769DRAFT_1673806 [Suillus cothurnatus]|nr:hypothetical protein BD769DRAFT_1673806 [Suillus cothurnatus]